MSQTPRSSRYHDAAIVILLAVAMVLLPAGTLATSALEGNHAHATPETASSHAHGPVEAEIQWAPGPASGLGPSHVHAAGTPAAHHPVASEEPAGLTGLTQQGPALPIAAVGQSFLPQVTVVPVGHTVAWTQGAIPHTVTTSDEVCPVEDCDDQANDPANDDGDPDTFDERLSGLGSTFEHAFTEPGVYPYFCRYHDTLGMVGMVVVVDPDDPTAVGPEDVVDALPSG